MEISPACAYSGVTRTIPHLLGQLGRGKVPVDQMVKEGLLVGRAVVLVVQVVRVLPNVLIRTKKCKVN